MNKSFVSFSFGCRVNIAEKIKLDQELINHGFEYNTDNPSFYIINSCAVTSKAERETRQHINQVTKKFPHAQIILTGCAITYWLMNGKTIKQPVYTVTNSQKNNLTDFILKLLNQNQNQTHKPKSVKWPNKFLSSGRLLIKIQDGCARLCSFCIVPQLRGKPVSRSINDIISDINSYNKPIYEVILTGINTEYFGIGKNTDITDLTDEILKKTNIPRVSFGSIHPLSINDKFIDWYKKNASNPRFVHFFHIPIQSGSDRILTLMNRGYKGKKIAERIKIIKRLNNNAFIGTDIIVGFPDETISDFKKTYKFLTDNPFNRFHIFRYSARKGTPSYNISELVTEISEQKKKDRSNILIKLSEKKLLSQKKKMIGLTTKALTLNKAKDGYWHALLPNQIPINITSYNRNAKAIENVFIQKIQNNYLYGKILD